MIEHGGALVVMVPEALGFAVEAVGLLLLLGYGLCRLSLPRPGLAVLCAPVVGLSAATLANQWLTPYVPAPTALVLAGGGLAALSGVMAWRDRHGLASIRSLDWRPAAALTGAGAVAYLASLAFVFRTGAFTIASYPADPIHLYAPAAEWFVGHPFPPETPATVTDPILRYLDNIASRAMPGSVGTLDAGLSALTRWPVHAVFDPLDALLLVLTGLAVYALVHVGLEWSRLAGAIAAVLVSADALPQWAVVVGYQTELQTLPMLYGGLALIAWARRGARVAPWVLAGVVMAPLVGAYAPMAVLAAVLLVPTALVIAGRWLLVRRGAMQPGAVVGLGTALLLSAPAAYRVLFRGGASAWLAWSNPSMPPGGVARFYPFPYLVGTAPVTRFTMWVPPVFWDRSLTWAAGAAAIVLLAFVGLGLATLVRGRRFAAVGVCASALIYLAILGLVVHSTYGFLKTAAYLAPASMALAAIGVVGVRTWAGRPRPLRGPALAAGLAGVLALQIVSSTEEQALGSSVGPSMSASAAHLDVLRSLVPRGGTVLIYDPHDWSTSELTFMLDDEAVAYALTGYASARLVVAGPPSVNQGYLWYSAFDPPEADTLGTSERYDFVLTSPEVASGLPSSFQVVWTADDLDLALYRRSSPGPT